MNLMRGAIDLGEQSLQIDCSACAGRRDYQFHCFFVISSEAEGEVEKSLDISDTSNLAAAETSLDMTQVFIRLAEHRRLDQSILDSSV